MWSYVFERSGPLPSPNRCKWRIANGGCGALSRKPSMGIGIHPPPLSSCPSSASIAWSRHTDPAGVMKEACPSHKRQAIRLNVRVNGMQSVLLADLACRLLNHRHRFALVTGQARGSAW